MKLHRLILLVLSFVATIGFSQSNSKWSDHLSYNETFDLCAWGDKIVVASEFGVFIYNEEDNSISKFSKINGLLGEKITAIKALVGDDAFVVGYETGSFSIVYSDGRISQVNDIANSNVSGEKLINVISEYGDKIYLGTPFGIVEYNFVEEEFGDTFFFGPNGSYIYVNDIAFLGNEIFVATNIGVYKADANNPYLVDYNQWEVQLNIPLTKYNSIAELDGKIIANNSQGNTVQYLYKNSTWAKKDSYKGIVRIKSEGEFITYSGGNNVYVFDKNLSLHETINQSELGAKSAIAVNSINWISTASEGLAISENNNWNYVVPEGPYKNYSFRIKVGPKKLYVVYGYYDGGYTPKGRIMGYDIFDTKGWNYVEPSTFSKVGDLVNVAVDPRDQNHIYISSWRGGVVELQDNEKVETWVEDNTDNHIQKLYYAPDPNYVSIRIGGSVFDDDGNLWVANGWNVDRPFVVRMADGKWNSFEMSTNVGHDNGMAGITIDDNGNKWISTRDDGIWIYNEGDSFDSTGDDKTLRFTKSPNSGNLPDVRVNTVAIDKNNVAWIGTKLGLVVFSDIDDMFDLSYFSAEPIIINEDGVGKKLLGNQTINKIVVDGANNKWFATESGGVYYVSANGQKTIHHFTKDNSPLPSDRVFDLDVDPETGRVYFVTSKGLVSFIGNATEGGDDFSKVFAYPNPVRPGFDGDIYIKGLTDKTNVKITDINGNLIFETTSQGGQAVWNGRSLSGYKASSGVYLVFAVSKDGTDTAVTKILIVN